ncbi:hypothetical protein KsCSTR_00050 [Candidatus Kuenenia stuttgartiensis]|uniref:Uncharacterized protein n=1 Tax=Kuenenia stuttgartiensis TaxID=174633 RepID=A0A6G7GJ65_KUEST|nr:hypothetical protein KsCSTR_00050 [Candidatus Kuenenia stuttgartiensis]
MCIYNIGREFLDRRIDQIITTATFYSYILRKNMIGFHS